MLAGRAPYAHLRSFAQLLYSVVNTPAPPLREAAPWAPAEVAAIVDRAMSHALEARFPDAAAMLAALQRCAPEGDDLREAQLVAADRGARPEAPSAESDARRWSQVAAVCQAPWIRTNMAAPYRPHRLLCGAVCGAVSGSPDS